jgi:hypothetical protein
MCEDADGLIWFGTSRGCIASIDDRATAGTSVPRRQRGAEKHRHHRATESSGTMWLRHAMDLPGAGEARPFSTSSSL